jgi:hypothetical protein
MQGSHGAAVFARLHSAGVSRRFSFGVAFGISHSVFANSEAGGSPAGANKFDEQVAEFPPKRQEIKLLRVSPGRFWVVPTSFGAHNAQIIIE